MGSLPIHSASRRGRGMTWRHNSHKAKLIHLLITLAVNWRSP